jgi:hypothetical protein
MITNETNTNKIQQKYLDTLSKINSEMENLVNQLLVDEIQPTIEEIKQIDYNKAFKNALIERYKDSPLSKGLGNLIDKNNSTTTNFISTKICIILQKFEGGFGSTPTSNLAYNLSTNKFVVSDKKDDEVVSQRENIYYSELLFFNNTGDYQKTTHLEDNDCSHLIQLLYSELVTEEEVKSILTKQIQTTIKKMILNLGNEGIDEVLLPIKLLDEDGLDELQFQVWELRKKANGTKKDLSIELIGLKDSIKKLMKVYNFSMEQITKIFDYYDFILVLDAFCGSSVDEQSLIEQFLTTKPFEDTVQLVHLFKSELVKLGRKFKNNLQIIFDTKETFNRFLVELYLFKNGFVTEKSLQNKNNYNLSFVTEEIKNFTYKELFESFSSVTDVFVKHQNVKLFIFGDITEVLENSQLEFDFTIDTIANRSVLASKIPDFYSRTYKKLFTKFPITFNLTLEQTSKLPYIKDYWEFEDILFFIESKIPETSINISIELANWSDDDKIITSQPLNEIEESLKTELQNLFKVSHQNLTLVDLKLNCEWE